MDLSRVEGQEIQILMTNHDPLEFIVVLKGVVKGYTDEEVSEPDGDRVEIIRGVEELKEVLFNAFGVTFEPAGDTHEGDGENYLGRIRLLEVALRIKERALQRLTEEAAGFVLGEDHDTS